VRRLRRRTYDGGLSSKLDLGVNVSEAQLPVCRSELSDMQELHAGDGSRLSSGGLIPTTIA
jgi:hypothetical protein